MPLGLWAALLSLRLLPRPEECCCFTFPSDKGILFFSVVFRCLVQFFVRDIKSLDNVLRGGPHSPVTSPQPRSIANGHRSAKWPELFLRQWRSLFVMSITVIFTRRYRLTQDELGSRGLAWVQSHVSIYER